jgi:CTP-dependent riboflavin kinase
MARLILAGQVVTGRGQGATFTQLDWAREQFITKLGIDPFPGTLNLHLNTAANLSVWADLKTRADC